MRGTLVSDLGLDPEVWLFLSLLGCVTVFFKFSRLWSVRNLDLLLLFVLVPGMMLIVSSQARPPWSAFIWLFLGSGAWLVRCLLDLGLVRRPLLEPNLSAPACSACRSESWPCCWPRRSACPFTMAPLAIPPSPPSGRICLPAVPGDGRRKSRRDEASDRTLAADIAQEEARAGHRFPGARGSCP